MSKRKSNNVTLYIILIKAIKNNNDNDENSMLETTQTASTLTRIEYKHGFCFLEAIASAVPGQATATPEAVVGMP